MNNHTSTGAWGSVPYWNAYVGTLEMHSRGTFSEVTPARICALASSGAQGQVQIIAVLPEHEPGSPTAAICRGIEVGRH